MIIKSLSRKAGGRMTGGGRWISPFANLARYMNRGVGEWEGQAVLWHNFYGSEQSSDDDIIAAFEDNAALLCERKNGNVLYHEILSFSGGHGLHGADIARTVADVGQEYLRERASEQLAYGVVHLDTENIHLHLMISANPAGRPERVRLTRDAFAQAQKNVERFALERYPELAQTRVYNQDRWRERLKSTVHEQAMTARTQSPSRKEALKDVLQQAFDQAGTPAELTALCEANGIVFYRRGKTVGVVAKEPDGSERKHRLSTLGLLERYEAVHRRFSEQVREEPEQKIAPTQAMRREQELREIHQKARERDNLQQAAQATQAAQDLDAREKQCATASGILLPGEDILFQYLNMNTKQAKELSLPSFLDRLGYVPARSRWNELWYTSPFRPDERTPSFKIDHGKNFWYDFGMGKGGTIIEFVQHLYATEDVARALFIIADATGGVAHAVKRTEPAPDVPKEKPIIESVGQITDRMLEAYVLGRAIPMDLARMYLQEISYRIGGCGYRALAFANDAQGFEVRNPWFKGTMGKKDITFLQQPGRRDAAVFEGVFDFLSMLVYHGQDKPGSNVLVCNSVALVDRAIERLKAQDIRKLYGYLDHDEAWGNALETLREREPWEVIDGSGFYLGHKDANDFLIERRARKRDEDERER